MVPIEIVWKLTMAWTRQWKWGENDEFDRYLGDNFGETRDGYTVWSKKSRIWG